MWSERIERNRGFANVARGGRVFPLLLGLFLAAVCGGPAWASDDSCIECHRDPKFAVTNRKLYEYYRDWESSIHRQEEVSCSDCHGGRPDLADKEGAHGGEVVGESATASAVNFQNIPKTCGACHDEIYQSYRTSHHYEHLVTKEQEKQGPNCVTCHGSINVSVLSVNTVQAVCRDCHNQETENHPEIPERAKEILNQFLSISRFYRYVAARGEPGETRRFFSNLDQRVYQLSIQWHTFDLCEIESLTRDVLLVLKERRDLLRGRQAAQRASE